ncbi:MAG: moderate conductance mechanosensitive channel, partial [Verrucomicrobiota bacterium]
MAAAFLNPDNIQTHETSEIVIRVIVVISMAVVAHFLVWLVRFISEWIALKSAAKKTPVGFVTQQPKFITLTGLLSSALTFIIYSVALGLMLWWAFGVNPKTFLTTYLATASVIGLAVGFGSQGLVQDVVTGLTLIFSDTLDVGDLIEVSGQIGRVEKVGLRFTQVTNLFNQQVFMPNRTIANIARFPRGGIYAYADVQIPPNADRTRAAATVDRIAKAMWMQFNAIILAEPELSEIETVHAESWNYLRVQFKIWPGQGGLIETTFRSRIANEMKALDPNYADWMVTVIYRATAK